MKTWTANFTTKVEKQEGEQPCFLVTIEYGLLGYTLKLTNADKNIILGSDTYKPYIINIDPISKEIPIEEYIATINNGSLRIMRNSDTDILLTNIIKNHEFKIWQFFDGLVDADKLSLGTFMVNSITGVTQSYIEITFKNRETELVDLPKDRFNLTDYPNCLEANIGQGVPFILGDITDVIYPSGSPPYIMPYHLHKRPSVVACFNSNRAERKFLAHKLSNDAVQSQEPTYVYKLEGDHYARLELGAGIPNYSWDLTGNKLEIIVNDAGTGGSTTYGDRRAVRIMATMKGQLNQSLDWQDATDLDTNTTATVNNSHRLELTFQQPNFLPSKNSDYFIRRAGFYISSVGSGATLSFYIGRYGGSPTLLGTTGAGGYDESFDISAVLDLETYKLTDYYLKIESNSANDSQVDALYLYLIYEDGMDIEESTEVQTIGITKINRRRSGSSRLEPAPIVYGKPYKEGYTINDIFCSALGPNTVLQPGSISYPYDHPLYLITFILNRILGYSLTTEIDGTSFDDAYTYLNLEGRTWHLGRQVQTIENALDLLGNILSQCFLKLFRGDDGKWKLFKINKYGGETITYFRDYDKHDSATDPAMVYQMTDFKFYQNPSFFNKFIMNYHLNLGIGKYDFTLTKDRNNDAQLLTSYQEHSSSEIIYPVQEYDWHRQSPETNLFLLLKKFWRYPALIIEFDTNLVGTKLEEGDTIRTNHKTQAWTSNLKDFQIFGLEQDGNTIHIKAIEIML